MALEKTTLNHIRIAHGLKQHYGLCVQETKRLSMGSANCYRVKCSEQTVFVKELQSDVDSDAIVREAALTDYLREHEFPAVRFLKTLQGDAFFLHEGHVVCVQEYIEGTTCGYDDFPTERLNDSARLLGRLHRTLRDYSLPRDMDAAWLARNSLQKMAEQYGALEKMARALPESETHARLLGDLSYKKQLALRCGEYACRYEGVTYTPSHGDYQGCQLILDGDAIRAVVDFSAARTIPAVWEVMRSFIQSDRACRKTAKIDVPRLTEYVRAYRENAPLTRRDLEAMPYVYLFQLARSRYGYTEYLKTDSEDREGLLAFAFWRTAMCREVEARAEEIVQALIRT